MNELSITDIKLSDYTYELPDERIAKFPLTERDHSKLQVYHQGEITHTQFYQIADYLPKGSLLVFNNTKVIPARIHFQKANNAGQQHLIRQIPQRVSTFVRERILRFEWQKLGLLKLDYQLELF